VFAAGGGGLRVVALDARSGAIVWSDAASSSGIPPGEPPVLAVVGDVVIYPATVGGRVARLVGADARTGRVIWQGPRAFFTAWPSVCPGMTTAVCLTGVTAAQPNAVDLLSYDAATGRPLATVPFSAPGALGRNLGPGLFDPGGRQPEMILAASGSGIAWSKPLAQIFTLPGASSDWGWQFDRPDNLGLFVGSVGSRPIVLTSKRYVTDLSRAMTVGFRIRDGSVVWRTAGSYSCSLLPCPGDGQSGFSSPANASANVIVGVLLRERGRESASTNGDYLPTLSSDATGSVQGVNPANGRVLWSVPLGSALRQLAAGHQPPQTGLDTIALTRQPGRMFELDLRSGSLTPISPSTPAWCRTLSRYKQAIPYKASNGLSLTNYVGQFSLSPCIASGGTRPMPQSVPSFVGAIGGNAAGLVAWSEPNAVIAAPAAG
jgi:outer membrane protein assembly factor BamB